MYFPCRLNCMPTVRFFLNLTSPDAFLKLRHTDINCERKGFQCTSILLCFAVVESVCCCCCFFITLSCLLFSGDESSIVLEQERSSRHEAGWRQTDKRICKLSSRYCFWIHVILSVHISQLRYYNNYSRIMRYPIFATHVCYLFWGHFYYLDVYLTSSTNLDLTCSLLHNNVIYCAEFTILTYHFCVNFVKVQWQIC